MFEGFPYTNFHELNLDWIIKIAKEFLDQYTNIQQTITQGLEDLDTKAQQLQALLDAWYDEHSADIAQQLADALQDLNDWYTEHQGYLDQYLQDSITAFGAAADAKAAETIATIPDDYSAVTEKVQYLTNTLNTGRKIIYGANISSAGVIEESTLFNIFCYKVKPGSLIKQLVSQDGVLYAFYTAEPALTSVSYNNARFVEGTPTGLAVNIHVPANVNWIAIRNSINNTSYITPDSYLDPKFYGYEQPFMLTDDQFSAYTGESDSGYWASGNTYPAGYITEIETKPLDPVVSVIIVDSVTSRILFKNSSDTDTITVNQYFENPVYIYVNGVYFMNNSSLPVGTFDFDTVADTHDIGFIYTRTFRSGTYIFAVRPIYKTVTKDNLFLKPYGIKRLFVSGDSITAGYPYILNVSGVNNDIKFGNQIARRLNFDVTFGAQSGSGWVYLTGTNNAHTITVNTDFADYDVAVFAWGTNDYGNDAPLGDHTDAASDSGSVCAMVKWCLNKMYNDNPAIVPVIILPINRSDKGTKANNWAYGYTNNAGYTLGDLCDEIKAICEDWGIPYIDNRVSPFNRFTLQTLLIDNLHPTSYGYKVLGSHLTGEMARIISPYYLNGYSEG